MANLKGMLFPFRVSAQSGRAAASVDVAQIESCLKMLLTTDPGSRPMRRRYGVGLQALVQEPNDQNLRSLFRRIIFEEVTRWEPRVIINDVVFESDEQIGTLKVILYYELSETGESKELDISFGVS